LCQEPFVRKLTMTIPGQCHPVERSVVSHDSGTLAREQPAALDWGGASVVAVAKSDGFWAVLAAMRASEAGSTAAQRASSLNQSADETHIPHAGDHVDLTWVSV